MLIPLSAVVALLVAVTLRLPEVKEFFLGAWAFDEQSHQVTHAMARARNAHVLAEDSGDQEHFQDFRTHAEDLNRRIGAVASNALAAPFHDQTTNVSEQVQFYVAAVSEIGAAHSAIANNDLTQLLSTLRADTLQALDTEFIRSSNEITDIARTFDCASQVVSSKLLRDHVEVLRARLDLLVISLPEKVRIQNNINHIRGSFASLLLACQDLERAVAIGASTYASANDAVVSLGRSINDATLSRLNERVAAESTALNVLAAGVLVVFLGGFAFTLKFSGRFGRQLHSIIEAIRRIATGDRTVTVPFIGDDDEFGALATNVERLRKNSLALESAMIEARHASEAKSQFLATVSHELRTPLNAILGFAEIIRDGLIGPLPFTYREYAKDIHASGEVLLKQISQILDLSKIEHGEFDLDQTSFDLNDVVRTALRRFERRIAVRTLKIEWNVLAGTCVYFDRGHLLQIVSNLLDNAIKYNVDGGAISIATAPADDGTELVISDTGVGMQEDEAARAHEPFVQFGATRDSLQGVGLGLSIVARLVKANGARMNINSRKSEGTQVTLVLPAARDERQRGVA